ncbi:reverse transcriptase [Plakobranchus ocellatus]|uniref:Reverse transcriptase n=1 Tax=Plakobranchus ocellatus TaxID=259542 RepID=A0AAV3ZEV6_9GAST|nr:reverse transcriptase [Plakobranchus ocellatus]
MFITVWDIRLDSVLVDLLVPNVPSDLIRVATLLEQLVHVPICLRPGHVRQTCFKLRDRTSRAGLTANILPYYCLSAESSFNKDGALSIDWAKVFGRSCTLLRDSGCNTAAAKEDLVPADCLMGRVARVTTSCCQNRRFPTAIIDLDCDYFSGPVGVCVLQVSVADVILGNIKGVRPLTVPPMVNVATK